jgi:hypothetical protein
MAHGTAFRCLGCVGLVLALLVSGCGLWPAWERPLQVTIQNATDSEAILELVEYDFVTNQVGERLAEPRPLAAGATTSADMDLPRAESWALMVNQILAVTSLDVATLARNQPGEGPFHFSVLATDDGLEISASRTDTGSGTSTAPPR